MAFENSPFKLTQEILDVMDGECSEQYEYFRTLLIRGFLEARKHMERIVLQARAADDIRLNIPKYSIYIYLPFYLSISISTSISICLFLSIMIGKVYENSYHVSSIRPISPSPSL